MCWIMVKKAGNKVPFNYMDKAQKFNKDGYGVSWFEDGEIKVYRTLNYKRFKAIVSSLKDSTCVVHLRNTTVGQTNIANCHPFEIPSGVMFHNGTMYSLKPFAATNQSDTDVLANLINECEYESIDEIKPLIRPIIGTTINRLVFFENTGKITIMNRELGIEEDGNWYSNDYHLKDKGWNRGSTASKTVVVTKEKDSERVLLQEGEKYKVFVYGTLKEGFSNHTTWMRGTKFIEAGSTTNKWAMIGKNMGFPYMLEEDRVNGFNCKGEVYECTPEQIKTLDRLEGFPTHYKRKYVDITLDGGQRVKAIMYYKASVSYIDYSKEYIEEFVGRIPQRVS